MLPHTDKNNEQVSGFKLNFSGYTSEMHYFSNKLSKIASTGLSAPSALFSSIFI